jgi:hypothetical protein
MAKKLALAWKRQRQFFDECTPRLLIRGPEPAICRPSLNMMLYFDGFRTAVFRSSFAIMR